MLKLQFRDNRKPAIWLVDSRYAIGRDSSNDIVLDVDGISSFHAEIRIEDGDRVFIADTGSTQGTLINGSKVRSRTQLKAGDVIDIQGIELELVDPKQQMGAVVDDGSETAIAPALNIPGEQAKVTSNPGWKLVARTGALVGKTYEIPATGRVVVGRSQSCDIVLPSNHVSRQHAELSFRDGKLHVVDMNSSNGTFVNRKRVTDCRLKPDDELRLDTLVFRIEGPSSEKGDAERTVELAKPALDKPEQKTFSEKKEPVQVSSVSSSSADTSAAASGSDSVKKSETPITSNARPATTSEDNRTGNALPWLLLGIVIVGASLALVLI